MGDQYQEVSAFTVKLRQGDVLIRVHAEDMIALLESAKRFPNGTVNFRASKLAFRDRKGYTHEKPLVVDERWERPLKQTA
jgi:hypothetical protein